MCLPYLKLSISCWSVDRNPPPPIFTEDFYLPVSAEWKQQLKPQKLPHGEFFCQLCSHGNFQESQIQKYSHEFLTFIRNGQQFS